MTENSKAAGTNIARIGLAAGPALGVLVYLLAGGQGGLGHAGAATAAVAAWMAIWWMTEAIPIYATGLLPLPVFPLLGIRGIGETAAPYGHELIFLFLGGFLVALAMERWGLHRRIAAAALALVGDRAERVVGAFMAVTAFLSMWVSNTATAILMLPIAVSVIGRCAGDGDRGEQERFAVALLLGIAYGASIGGVATLIGTPPNLFLASFARDQLGTEIGFASWMAAALPLALVLLVLAWWLLTAWLYPCRGYRLGVSMAGATKSGPMNRGERATLIVFLITAGLWITRPLLQSVELGGMRPLAGLTDTGIAVAAGLALFVLPGGDGRRVMDWEATVRLPWGLLVLFGGGLSLAAALQANGVSDWIGQQLAGFRGLSPVLVVLLVTATMILLTELTSNTATTAAMVPIFAAVAEGLGMQPLVLCVAVAVAASCAFMLPVATPPNAIVFGSGRLRIPQMVRAGVWMGLLSVVLVTAWAFLVVGPRLGG